jgi:hypothetical protein
MLATLPLTVKSAAELVCKRIPDIETVPAFDKVQLPAIMTFGVIESQMKAHKLTPTFRVKFSVYVPGRINMVSPDDAEVIAAAIVECVPRDNVESTIHLATPNLLSEVC